MVTPSDLQYGFFIDFEMHVGDSVLIVQPLIVCYRVEDACIMDEEVRNRPWVERLVYQAYRRESDMYRVEGQLPSLFRNERSMLFISAMDCREDVVFSITVTPRWIRTQIQRLIEGLEADPLHCSLKNKSDIVETTLWVRCIGSKLGKCVTQPLASSPSPLDEVYFELEKECLAFRSWTTSLIQKENFPFTMTSQHCSLPIYSLCCLEDVIDQKSFEFRGRLPFLQIKAKPWVNDWCKAWTVASSVVKDVRTQDKKHLLWWCFVDLLVGNTSSHRKDDMYHENEMPMPSFGLSRFSSPLDRLARRLAFSRFISSLKYEKAALDVVAFTKSTVQREETSDLLKNSWTCIAIACDNSGRYFLLHALCGKEKLNTLKMEERMDALENAVFYYDEFIRPAYHRPAVLQLLMLCWCNLTDICCVVTCKPHPIFARSASNEYCLRLKESHGIYPRRCVPIGRVHRYISVVIETEGSKLLRPHLAKLPTSGINFPMWVEWQIGWIHPPSSLRVAMNMPLTYVTPQGFQMPLARTQKEGFPGDEVYGESFEKSCHSLVGSTASHCKKQGIHTGQSTPHLQEGLPFEFVVCGCQQPQRHDSFEESASKSDGS